MNEQVSTDVGTEILFENDHVRVWEMVLEPGGSMPLHCHLHDHVLIYPEPGHIRGKVQGVDQEVEQDVDPGWVYFRAVGPEGSPPHSVTNVGPDTSRHYIVEMKGESASSACQAAEHNGRGRFVYPNETT